MPESKVIYDYAKIYKDTFDRTSWRIIHNEPHPIPAWASWIWITLLMESTPAKGVLMRNDKRAYKKDELKALFHVKKGKSVACQQFDRAFQLLVDQGVITEADDGVITIVYAAENFGSETRAAKRKREARLRAQNCSDENFSESSDSIEGEGGQMSFDCPPSVHQQKPPNNKINNNPQESIKALEHYDEEEEKIDFSEILVLSTGFVAKYPKKPATLEYARKIEAFVSTLTKAEILALELAAERKARDVAQNKLYGGKVEEPLPFAKSRPWTPAEISQAESMLETQRLTDAMGGGGGDGD